MRIILSRKGFDGVTGKTASPILLPSGPAMSSPGYLWSIPIPEPKGGNQSTTQYQNIRRGSTALGTIVNDLTKNKKTKIVPSDYAHFDPDLEEGSIPRKEGWRGVFGQGNRRAYRILQKGKVGIGDLFLFFGWFKQVEKRNSLYRYKRNAPNLHVLFGWLQVGGQVSPAYANASLPWLRYFPHCIIPRDAKSHDTFIYLSADKLILPGMSREMLGAGVFRKYHEALRLTAPGQRNRGLWRLPKWMIPEGRKPLGLHDKPWRWTLHEDHVRLRTVGRGQDFVLDTSLYPEAVDWARNIIETHG